jgi:hypothetical protein
MHSFTLECLLIKRFVTEAIVDPKEKVIEETFSKEEKTQVFPMGKRSRETNNSLEKEVYNPP